MVIALGAVCVSVASLWVALRTDRTQERLLAASVWPVLLVETSDYAEGGTPGVTRNVIQFSVTNAGVGPARVKWFDVYYHRKPIENGHALLQQCCGDRQRALSRVQISNYMQTRVMTARETIHFLEIPRNATNVAEWNVLDKARQNVYVRACYCSVLDECWLLDSRNAEPASVRGCPPADTPLFQG